MTEFKIGYLEKYKKNKKKVLDYFYEAVKQKEALLSEVGYKLTNYGFADARNEDDYIEFIWTNKSGKLMVCFWIGFWKDYKLNEDFLVTYNLVNKTEKTFPAISKTVKFKELQGNNIQSKIWTLIEDIKTEISFLN